MAAILSEAPPRGACRCRLPGVISAPGLAQGRLPPKGQVWTPCPWSRSAQSQVPLGPSCSPWPPRLEKERFSRPSLEGAGNVTFGTDRARLVPGSCLATPRGAVGSLRAPPLVTLGWPLLSHCSPYEVCEWGPGRHLHQVTDAVPDSGLLRGDSVYLGTHGYWCSCDLYIERNHRDHLVQPYHFTDEETVRPRGDLAMIPQ